MNERLGTRIRKLQSEAEDRIVKQALLELSPEEGLLLRQVFGSHEFKRIMNGPQPEEADKDPEFDAYIARLPAAHQRAFKKFDARAHQLAKERGVRLYW